MKLVLAPVRLEVERPIQTAHGPMHVRTGWRVVLEADGVTGRGEAMPMASFTEPAPATERALRAFELAQLPHTLEEIAAATAGLSDTPAARFAVECALLEHLARRKRVPVAALFGKPRPHLKVNALIEGDDAAALAKAAERAAADGYPVVKVKVAARPLSVEAQRLLAVRRAVGPKVGIRLDANGGWSEAKARSALRGLEALDAELCEQPVVADDVEGLRRIRHYVPCKIAADESMLLPHVLERMLEKDPAAAVDVVVLKPTALGGLIRSLEIARIAHAAGVGAYATTLMDGPLARAAAAHLAAVLPGDGFAHGLSTVELFGGAEPDAFTPAKGLIHLPDTPGWGIR
ncbi:MAG: mandelate racemase/muconate lactonizing enzyme family protein [Myxococcota bacterium]